MHRFVIDTSALVQAFVFDPLYADTEKVRDLITKSENGLIALLAPELIIVETCNVIVKSKITTELKSELINIFFLEC